MKQIDTLQFTFHKNDTVASVVVQWKNDLTKRVFKINSSDTIEKCFQQIQKEANEYEITTEDIDIGRLDEEIFGKTDGINPKGGVKEVLENTSYEQPEEESSDIRDESEKSSPLFNQSKKTIYEIRNPEKVENTQKDDGSTLENIED
jgi:hypothetical protein